MRNTIWSNRFIKLKLYWAVNELPQSQQYTEMEEETICSLSSSRNWSSVGICLVTLHKCILIVLAKLELSTGTEYNMLLNHPESAGWRLNLQILFMFFYHCDGLPFLSFWTLSKNTRYCVEVSALSHPFKATPVTCVTML